ncbi:hypothetical protein K0U00_34045, partial [Paenibacillus sepulcri]|nr:hypothetical protein [Paenibacillus sepulcri]
RQNQAAVNNGSLICARNPGNDTRWISCKCSVRESRVSPLPSSPEKTSRKKMRSGGVIFWTTV